MINLFRGFLKRSPKHFKNWTYLGWRELTYYEGDVTNITETFHIQFYAKGKDLEYRKIECDQARINKTKEYSLKCHGFYQKAIVPWLNGGNIYSPISNPSEAFIEIVSSENGYTFMGGKWVKPAIKVEHKDNVITLPVKGNK